ncbi:MAG: energy transducer TonB [Pseudomonadota bacterium]
MSTVQPTSSPPGPRFGLSQGAWRVVAVGFGVGLLLFFLLWLDIRDNGDFYRPEGKPQSADGQIFEPLPAPMAGGDRSASGLSEAAEEALRNPRPAPPPAAQASTEAPPADRPGTDTADRPQPTARPAGAIGVPVPISRPAPAYPTEAMRNNETGTVLLQITVDASGDPQEVRVKRSSRSRALDRAAAQAARRWKFRPAQQDGRPVEASVEVPITFTLEGR